MRMRQLIADFQFVRRRANQKLPVMHAGNKVWFDYYSSGAAEFDKRISRLPRLLRWLALKTAAPKETSVEQGG